MGSSQAKDLKNASEDSKDKLEIFASLRKNKIVESSPATIDSSIVKKLGLAKSFDTMSDAKKHHYQDLSKLVIQELDDKLKFRKVSLYFMLAVVGAHFIFSVIIIVVVLYFRSQGTSILSDNALLGVIVSLMVNFLTTLGIIFKYVFSSTLETYTHIENTAEEF